MGLGWQSGRGDATPAIGAMAGTRTGAYTAAVPSENHDVPMVSVAMTAYNSERWIARAIESVLRQTCPFPVEIVAGDDCSRDGTVDVVRSYCARYPGRLRLLAQRSNVGMQRNYFAVFEECRGKYVAWLDADDVWTDPEKLQRQVEVLEREPQVAVCGHFVRFVLESGEVTVARYPRRAAGRYGLGQMIRGNFVPSVSMMFRNGVHRELPEWYFELGGVSDWPMLLAAGRTGDFILLDRVMADYHQTPGSAYSATGFLRQHRLDMQVRERVGEWLGPRWARDVRAGIGLQYEDLSYGYRQTGDRVGARKAAWQAFRSPELRDNLGSKLRTLAKAWLASVAKAERQD